MSHNSTLKNLLIGILFFIGFGFSSYFTNNLIPLFVLIAYVSYHLSDRKDNIGNFSYTSLWFIFAASAIAFLAYSYKNYGPRDWDYTCFFLYGNVATKGMDFYNPADYHSILNNLDIPIELNSTFIREVIDVGCPYPPPTLFLFSILGFFSYEKGLIIWTIINYLFLLGSIFLIENIFFNKKGLKGFMVSTILVLSFEATLTTVYFTQILFILLFFLLLFYKNRDKPLGGIFLSIAIFLKPFAAILFLYLLIKKQKMGILFFLLGCLIICLMTATIFGINPFIQYLFNNPALREPDWLFTENINQSLLAELYRNIPEHQLIAKYTYFLLTGMLTLVVGGVIYKNASDKKMNEILVVILLTFVLIIYPSGMSHYLVVHLLSLLILLKHIKRIDTSAILIFLFYVASYAGLFYVNIFLLLICLTIVYWSKINFFYYELKSSIKL